MYEFITDEQCKADGASGARFCKACRQVIYMGSTLPEDAYYADADGYYRHQACPAPLPERSLAEKLAAITDDIDESLFPLEDRDELWGLQTSH
ncbi:MAG: hypothetical protein WDN09_01260 [bacterium]